MLNHPLSTALGFLDASLISDNLIAQFDTWCDEKSVHMAYNMCTDWLKARPGAAQQFPGFVSHIEQRKQRQLEGEDRFAAMLRQSLQ